MPTALSAGMPPLEARIEGHLESGCLRCPAIVTAIHDQLRTEQEVFHRMLTLGGDPASEIAGWISDGWLITVGRDGKPLVTRYGDFTEVMVTGTCTAEGIAFDLVCSGAHVAPRAEYEVCLIEGKGGMGEGVMNFEWEKVTRTRVWCDNHGKASGRLPAPDLSATWSGAQPLAIVIAFRRAGTWEQARAPSEARRVTPRPADEATVVPSPPRATPPRAPSPPKKVVSSPGAKSPTAPVEPARAVPRPRGAGDSGPRATLSQSEKSRIARLLDMAVMYRRENVVEKARRKYEMVLEIDPGNEAALAGLRELASQTPDPSTGRVPRAPAP